MIKLLLVEDDANLRYVIQGGLEDIIGGYEVRTAATGEEGLRVWEEFKPDIIGKAKQICPLWPKRICPPYLSYDCPFKSPGDGGQFYFTFLILSVFLRP